MTRAQISRLFTYLDTLGVSDFDADRTQIEMLLIDLRVRAQFREQASREALLKRDEPAPVSSLF